MLVAPTTCGGAERWSHCVHDTRSRHNHMLCPLRMRKYIQTLLSSRFNSRAHNLRQENQASVAPWRARKSEPSQRRSVRRHRLQPALDFRFVAPVEGISASEMPGPSQDLLERNQRCEASLLSMCTVTRHDLQLSKIVFVSVLRQCPSSDDALFRIMSFADSAVWSGSSSLMNKQRTLRTL